MIYRSPLYPDVRGCTPGSGTKSSSSCTSSLDSPAHVHDMATSIFNQQSVSPSALHSHSLPIVEPTPMHYRPQRPVNRNARRPSEPNRVPRPRNAFIIFRCQKVAQFHSKESSVSDRPPTPEKTLSKRAGAAWRLLPDAEKQVYKDLAEKERLEHQEKYPGYRYQPNRAKVVKPRAAGPLSRREQVESLVLRASSSHSSHNSESEESSGSSPISLESSSPEPVLGQAASVPPTHGLAHRRSMSLPHLQMAQQNDPYPFSRTYFIEPTSCGSSPGLGPHRTRRSSSARNRSYSPSVSTIPPPDCAFDLDFGNATIPFSTLAAHSSTLSLPELVTLSEGLVLQDSGSSGYSTPQTSPAASIHEQSQPEYFAPPQAASNGPLFHRRQRSNTAPSAMLSPLSVLTSSLGNWNGEVTATAVATGGMPTFSLTPPDGPFSMTPTSSSSSLPVTSSPLTDGTVPYADFFGSNSRDRSVSPSSLPLVDTEVDMDRTPRVADFPSNVQDVYSPHYSDMSPIDDFSPVMALESSYDLDSYAAGLNNYEIPWDMAPFGELDINDLIHTPNLQ